MTAKCAGQVEMNANERADADRIPKNNSVLSGALDVGYDNIVQKVAV